MCFWKDLAGGYMLICNTLILAQYVRLSILIENPGISSAAGTSKPKPILGWEPILSGPIPYSRDN
jgi:hypothetical protein